MRFIVLFVLLLCNKLQAQNNPKYEFMGLPQDKQRHFAIGACVAGMTYTVAYDYYHAQNPLTAHQKATKATLGINISMALLKELYDYGKAKQLNTWNDTMRKDSLEDILATFLGGASVTLIIRIGAEP